MVSADAGAEGYRRGRRAKNPGHTPWGRLLIAAGLGAFASYAGSQNEGVRERVADIFQPHATRDADDLNARLFHDGGMPVERGSDNLPYSFELLNQLRTHPGLEGKIPANAVGARYFTDNGGSYQIILRRGGEPITVTDPNEIGQLAVHATSEERTRTQIDD